MTLQSWIAVWGSPVRVSECVSKARTSPSLMAVDRSAESRLIS